MGARRQLFAGVVAVGSVYILGTSIQAVLSHSHLLLRPILWCFSIFLLAMAYSIELIVIGVAIGLVGCASRHLFLRQSELIPRFTSKMRGVALWESLLVILMRIVLVGSLYLFVLAFETIAGPSFVLDEGFLIIISLAISSSLTRKTQPSTSDEYYLNGFAVYYQIRALMFILYLFNLILA